MWERIGFILRNVTFEMSTRHPFGDFEEEVAMGGDQCVVIG